MLSNDVEVIENDLPTILGNTHRGLQRFTPTHYGRAFARGMGTYNLARHLHEDPESLEPTSTSLIEETEDLSELASELPATYYKRFLDLLTRVYPEK